MPDRANPAPTTQFSGRIVVVDDDPGMLEVLSDFLGERAFEVETASDGDALTRALADRPADLVVLDIMLPGEDGLEICRRLTANGGPPIILLSARAGATDRIVGLEAGADDYLEKPCNPMELLARVRAVLRRCGETASAEGKLRTKCEFAGWRLDLLRRELRSPDGVLINLSSGEFALLRSLVEHPEQILTRDQLLDLALGQDAEVYDRAVDVQISRLRRKLDYDGRGGDLIRTLPKKGYMFVAKVVRR